MNLQRDEDGGSLPELVVASLVTLVAAAAALSVTSGPVRQLSEVAQPDARRAEMEAAADRLARVVRSARSGLDTPAIRAAGPFMLSLRVGPASEGVHVTFVLEDGSLIVRAEPAASAGASAAVESVLDGLGSEAVTFELLDADGLVVDSSDASAGSVEAIRFAIETDGLRTERVVALRAEPVHSRTAGW